MTPDELDARDNQVRLRIAQDVMVTATAAYWERRAAVYEWARPRPTDYLGRSTPTDQQARDQRLARMAADCRAHAGLFEVGEVAA